MYLSPITLTGLQPQFSGPELFKYNLPIARQRLLEKLTLRGTLEIGGRQLSREDIDRIFDEMADDTRLQYHLAIWQDPVLLRFLEEGILEPDKDFAANTLYTTPGFRQFVSPWYAQALGHVRAQLLTGKGDRTMLHRLEKHGDLLAGTDRRSTFRSVVDFTGHKKQELNGILAKAQAGEAVPREKLLYSLREPELFVLNSLPADFDALRQQLVRLFAEISAAYDLQKNTFLALAAAEKAAAIEVQDEGLRQQAVKNLAHMRRRQALSPFVPIAAVEEHKKGMPRGAVAAIITGAVCLLLVVVRLLLNGQHERARAAEEQKFGPDIVYDRNDKQPDQAVLNYITMLRSLLRTDTTDRPLHPYQEYAGMLAPDLDKDVYDISAYDAWPPPRDTSAAARRPGAEKRLRICNYSSWPVVVWYLLDERHIRNRYLPPHDSLLLEYRNNSIRLDLQAGKNWSDTLHHRVSLYTSRYDIGEFCLKGGFSELPENRKKFCNPEYLSLYSRNGVKHYVYNDRLEFRDSTATYLIVRKYMDEGREER